MPLAGRSLITVDDLSDDDVAKILRQAAHWATTRRTDVLSDCVVATLFFEPSTRTRLSFQTAALRLGAQVMGFDDPEVTSVAKGESLEDTIRTISGYADLIVVRHPDPGSARRAADVATVPIVNAGDGAGEHPTQALLDLYTIKQERGRTGDHHVVLIGDLRHGRTVHSLSVLLARFGNRLTFVAPPGLEMPPKVAEACAAHGVAPTVTTDLQDAIGSADVLYVTRIQKERFPDPVEYEALKGSYVVDRALLKAARKDVTIMHPLPRVDEIATDVDTQPGAAYFRQAANGVPVRMAILAALLGRTT